MENRKFDNLSLAVYNAVKNYFLFYFPDYSVQYYYSQEITRLYELLLNKEAHPITSKWEEFIRDFKKKYPDYKIYNLHSNYPSWTIKVIIPSVEEDVTELNAYISISLIGPFYVFFMEEKKIDAVRLYIGPYGVYEDLFKQIEQYIEKIFPEYIFLNWLMLSKGFFNLISPGINTANQSDAQPNKNISVLKALFFDYEVEQEGFFDYAGGITYKSENNILEMNRQKMESMKELFNNRSVEYQEIE